MNNIHNTLEAKVVILGKTGSFPFFFVFLVYQKSLIYT